MKEKFILIIQRIECIVLKIKFSFKKLTKAKTVIKKSLVAPNYY